MTEPSLPKRLREETETTTSEEQEHTQYSVKRQKTCKQILPLLDEDEEELTQDYLTDIFSTLQQELSSSTSSTRNSIDLLPSNDVPSDENDHAGSCFSVCSQSSKDDTEEEDCNNVMRHLLEASDDELGLPNRGDGGSDDGEATYGDLPFPLNVGLWEIEDEAANYYAILQSELFM